MEKSQTEFLLSHLVAEVERRVCRGNRFAAVRYDVEFEAESHRENKFAELGVAIAGPIVALGRLANSQKTLARETYASAPKLQVNRLECISSDKRRTDVAYESRILRRQAVQYRREDRSGEAVAMRPRSTCWSPDMGLHTRSRSRPKTIVIFGRQSVTTRPFSDNAIVLTKRRTRRGTLSRRNSI